MSIEIRMKIKANYDNVEFFNDLMPYIIYANSYFHVYQGLNFLGKRHIIDSTNFLNFYYKFLMEHVAQITYNKYNVLYVFGIGYNIHY